MHHDECLKYSKYLYKAYNEMNRMVRVQTIQLRSDGVTSNLARCLCCKNDCLTWFKWPKVNKLCCSIP